MNLPTIRHVTNLLSGQEPPCISLYQPTHRQHPDNQQDPIRYRNMLTELENLLRDKYSKREVRPLLEQFQSLARDDEFWNHRTEGLAVLGSPGTFQIFELQRAVPELLVVAETFHLKPLLRVVQSADRYQILALSRHEAQLFEGNRYALDRVELTHVPATITDALGEELTEQHLNVNTYGAGAPRSPRGGEPGSGALPSVHAHGDKKEEVDLDRDRFFQVIDRGILEHHSRPSGLPLILAALKEHHDPFHAISHNPFLMADGIKMDPQALDLDQLRAEAWRVMEPMYLERLAGLVDNYNAARSRELASDDLGEVAEAAAAGRVGTLLVEAERQIPGRIDAATGQVAQGSPNKSVRGAAGELSDSHVDDLLDDVAELVLQTKGEVIVVPAERMPSDTGLAATYRF